MKQKLLDFALGFLFVLAYLVMAGVAGNNDPGVEEATTETADARQALICRSNDDYGNTVRYWQASESRAIGAERAAIDFDVHCAVQLGD